MDQIDISKYIGEETAFFEFLKDQQGVSSTDLLLKYDKKRRDISIEEAAVQIQCRRKTAKKLSHFLLKERFLFPDVLAAEQSSDERVARYHASLIGSGKNIIDMTAGLGIDAMTIADNHNRVTAIELNERKSAFLKYNVELFGISDFRVIQADSVDYIKEVLQRSDDPEKSSFPDIIFIDPARRDSDNRRTYAFSDCLPDITSFYKDLLDNGIKIMIKASPLLDIDAVLRQLDHVSEIHVVSVKGECKELLIILDKKKHEDRLIAVELDDFGVKYRVNGKILNKGSEIAEILPPEDISEGMFLYEPGAAVMKINRDDLLKSSYPNIRKAALNTHIYFSKELYKEFPGRVIKVNRVITGKAIKTLKNESRSIVTRNYPHSPDRIRKDLKLRESDKLFLYAFRSGPQSKPMMIDGELII